MTTSIPATMTVQIIYTLLLPHIADKGSRFDAAVDVATGLTEAGVCV
jgi:hypothetical protein